MKKRFERKNVMNPVVKHSVLPNIKKDISDLLNGEEAKVTAHKVLVSAVTLMTFLTIADQQNVLAGHSNNHTNVPGSHANQIYHFNSTGTGHVSRPYHGNSLLHTSSTPHLSSPATHANDATASSPISAHTNINETATKGVFHNNGSMGQHTAQLGHNNNINTHTSAGQVHSNANPHVNSSGHSSLQPHANTTSQTSALQHGNSGSGSRVNFLLTVSTHASHGSHGQW